MPISSPDSHKNNDDPRVRAELIDLLYRQAIPTLLSSYPACVLVAVMLQYYQPSSSRLLWSWFSVIVLTSTIRIGLVMVYKVRRPTILNFKAWGHTYAALAGVSGILWSLLNVFFFDATNLVVTLIISIILGVLASNAVGTLSAYVLAYVTFMLPIAGVFSIRMILEGGNAFLTISVFGVLFFIINVINCLNMNRTLRKAIVLGFENADLVHQLTEEKERAETATQDKSRFLAAASHDLRQPIHALGLFSAALCNIARRPAIVSTDVEDIAQRMRTSVMHLGQLLHSILDVSHLDAGALKPKPRPVSLMDEFEGLRDKFSVLAAEKGMRLVVRNTSETILTDPVFLRRILWNLVSNALRYTSRGGVLVACRRRGESAEIQVWDTGIGIEENQLGRIFDDFYRVDHFGGRQEREQGLGLGLSIVRRSAQLIDAPIKVKSVIGKGSVFSLTLPRCAAPLKLPAGEIAAAPTNLWILLIDDDAVVLKATAALLGAWGHNVVAVSDISSAVEASQLRKFDRILSDYRLADDTTGVDAIHAVWSQAGTRIPAIILTGDIAPKSVREIMASGLRLLQKPIEPDELRLAVHDVTDAHHAVHRSHEERVSDVSHS